MWRPQVSAITTLYYALRLFFIVECHRVLPLRYVCIQSSGIILIS